MLVIRFQRVGKRHQPDYRIVVQERRSKVGGPPVEYLGHYSPVTKKSEVLKDRLEYWMGVGAKPTPTVHNLLIRLGTIEGKKMPIYMKKKKEEVQASAGVSATTQASQAPTEAPKEQNEANDTAEPTEAAA